MNDKTTIEQKDGYLVITAEGVRTNFDSVVEGTKKIKEAAKAHNVKYVLADYRKISFKVPMADAFNLVKTYELEMPEFTDIIICAVTNRDNFEFGEFWESICNKRGYNYRIFLDYEKAEEWLCDLIKKSMVSK